MDLNASNIVSLQEFLKYTPQNVENWLSRNGIYCAYITQYNISGRTLYEYPQSELVKIFGQNVANIVAQKLEDIRVREYSAINSFNKYKSGSNNVADNDNNNNSNNNNNNNNNGSPSKSQAVTLEQFSAFTQDELKNWLVFECKIEDNFAARVTTAGVTSTKLLGTSQVRIYQVFGPAHGPKVARALAAIQQRQMTISAIEFQKLRSPQLIAYLSPYDIDKRAKEMISSKKITGESLLNFSKQDLNALFGNAKALQLFPLLQRLSAEIHGIKFEAAATENTADNNLVAATQQQPIVYQEQEKRNINIGNAFENQIIPKEEQEQQGTTPRDDFDIDGVEPPSNLSLSETTTSSSKKVLYLLDKHQLNQVILALLLLFIPSVIFLAIDHTR